jgi:hypothetical protein
MADVLLRLTALAYRPHSISWSSENGDEECSEKVDAGALVARFVRLVGYGGGLVDVSLGLSDPRLDMCGVTFAVLRPMSWGISDPVAVGRYVPKVSVPGFRLSPVMRFAFGPVDGWFAL